MIKDTLKGFKTFILRGNVVDLAVGLMIGAAFNAVVSSLVKDILTPFIGVIFKQQSFAAATFTIHGSQFMYGDFLNNVISFLITAAAVYFFVVLPINKLTARLAPKGPPPAATTKQCPECLSNIPIGAKRCAYCTSVLASEPKGASKEST